ncbi:MAG: hypothetical protein IKM66_00735 [Clostridia bacterium]|nr:hypothetical protein [Clostridia bacterium]
MKKAKALFAAGVIVVVAGLSAAMWYLNDSGILHNGNTTETYIDENNNNDGGNIEDNNSFEDNNDEEQTEVQQTTAETVKEVDETEINEFLSAFANVYFAEQGSGFDIQKCSDYELIQFAYLHIRNTDSESVILEQRDDSIMYYYGVPSDSVKDVVEKYFGVQIPEESVYTENDYAFFSYSNGYFYTPAADGLAYENTAVVDSVEYRNNHVIVRFSVYTGDEKYADGEAKIQLSNNNMNLVSYHIYN